MTKWLKDIQWKDFVFEKIFDIYSTNSGIDKNKLIMNKWNIPYITRSEKNNGIDFFIGKQDSKHQKDKKNVITIWLDTQTVNYQPCCFYTWQNIQILTNQYINYFNSQFLIPLIKKQLEKFNRGSNGATLTRLKRSKIILPSTVKNEPDYKFMERYVKEIEQEKLNKYYNHVLKKISEFEDYQEVPMLGEKERWEFEIGELFEIYTGWDLIISNIKKWNIPVISHSITNNGIADRTKEIPWRKIFDSKKTISLADRGNFYAFVQKTNFYIWTRVKALEIKSPICKEGALLFIANMINKQSVKFSYGNNATAWTDKLKILLPTNSDKDPDYHYMENYIKKIEYQKLKKYLEIKKLK